MSHTITITLPDQVYERVKVTAQTMSLLPEAVVEESLSLFFPAFEQEMPVDMQRELASLSLLRDTELWKIAHQTMDEQRQCDLRELADVQKHRPLCSEEHMQLEQLLREAEHIMLSKAEAYRVLAQRGHNIFSPDNLKQMS